MKAPRKTVKRPIYRHIEIEANDDKKEDVKIVEKKDDNAVQILNSPSIKFEENEPSFTTEDIMNDEFQLINTFNDIFEMDNFGFDIILPEDVGSII